MNTKEAIGQIVAGRSLSEHDMREVMDQIMSGEASPSQIGSFITALRMKGETVDEITGAVRVMRQKATFVDTGVDTEHGGVLLDIVGTGGDCAGTFNVSSTSAFVIAAGGVMVAKHGNRAVSSHCGSADVLEALGVDLSLPPDKVADCVRQVGIGFLFAPLLHGAMRHTIGPRREIGIRTMFNILGPMTNPAGANVQVSGVYEPGLTTVLAEVLVRLGMKRALIVCGESDQGNLDEITVTGPTRIADGQSDGDSGQVNCYSITPEQFGIERASLADISGGKSGAEAAEQVRAILSGAEQGAKTDMVAMNAGAALMAAGKATDMAAGIERARRIIKSGAAAEKLAKLVEFCRNNSGSRP
ncbi:MAG: anthranilate phosphoribosyltransferase [Desulfobulbaceae bacterium]|jgi:anthranilate phosphoribosyltransferase|nr:anthranilate phosphoribosyltransferase [Desulfobulbaceae bacterium]